MTFKCFYLSSPRQIFVFVLKNKWKVDILASCQFIGFYGPKIKIARRITGAKGVKFLAGFLQVSHMFLNISLQVTNNNSMKSLSCPYLVPNNTLTSHDSSL